MLISLYQIIKSYFQTTLKTTLLPLRKAETATAGKLREAALRRNDEDLLVHIRDLDCSVIEVRYHDKCFKAYINPVFYNSKTDGCSREPYKDSFDAFCEKYVEKKIIQGKKIKFMNDLFKVFVQMVHDVEKEDASSYKKARLKDRLKQRFPQLIFHQPRRRNTSEIVLVEDLSSGDIAESHVQMKNDLDLGNSTEESQDSCDNKFPDPEQDEQRIPFNFFYDTALELRHLVKDGPEFDSVWPPLSMEINCSSVEKMIPPRLYNFFDWMLGMSDDPQISSYVTLSRKNKAKVRCP